MTPLDFIASLPHGEAKAAALTVYNLMTPQWIEITDDPATLPSLGVAVIIRLSNGLEGFGYLGEWTEEGKPIWRKIITPVWDRYTQRVDSKGCKGCDEPVTHWRPI